MYCSITFKGRKEPQNPKMVKLEMILHLLPIGVHADNA